VRGVFLLERRRFFTSDVVVEEEDFAWRLPIARSRQRQTHTAERTDLPLVPTAVVPWYVPAGQ
jgi:hypothetical protein